MTDMRACHEEVVAADPGHELVLRRAAIDRAVLTERVAVADLEARGLAVVLEVLRRGADRRELEDPVVAAQRGRPLDHDVGTDPATGADDDARADHGVRPDLDIGCDAGVGCNQCRRMNGHGVAKSYRGAPAGR